MHGRPPALACCFAVAGQALAPSVGPIVKSGRIGEEAADSRVSIRAGLSVGKSPESQCEIRPIAGHALEEILCQGEVARLLLKQAKFAPEARCIGRLEAAGECPEGCIRHFNGWFLILSKKGQKRFREAGQVPKGDAWLVAVSITAEAVDGAIDRCRVS